MSDQPRAIIDLSHARRFRVGHLLLCFAVAVVVLLLTQGPSIRRAGERMDPGIIRTVVLAVGRPSGWAGEETGIAHAARDATAWLSPGDEPAGEGGFETTAAAPEGGGDAVAPVTPSAFSPQQLGTEVERRPLRRLLVTGDSLSQPLDAELARRLADHGVRTDRDPRLGSGISNALLVDWGKVSAKQARSSPDAVVMFIGANEGFPIETGPGDVARCCGAEWAAAYATRVRQMMNVYRRGGDGRVFWLTVPAPRDGDRAEISRAVNAAIEAAAAPLLAHVRLVDLVELFTPGWRYRASMPVAGRATIVRESDGIHLNADGARVAADAVLRALATEFTW